MPCQKACPYTIAIWQENAGINSNVQSLPKQDVKLKTRRISKHVVEGASSLCLKQQNTNQYQNNIRSF
jgi:hypothetical protein